MSIKKTAIVKEKILNILLNYGPMDVNKLCANIDSSPELIIGALQSILSHKEIIMAQEKINNRNVTWIAHPKTNRDKLRKIAGDVSWSNKKSLLNLRKLRKKLIEGTIGDLKDAGDLIDLTERNFSECKSIKKDIPHMLVYQMIPGQAEPVSYIEADKYRQNESEEEGINQNPFKLDEFQRIAINAVLDGNLVLVAAPTGTGKTLIAEKLAEQLIQNKLRMIYTSPLKALSNQKFRDFVKMFGKENVGLVTGDISINGSALLLVMTTEIFRNKCFGEPEELEGVGYVVFDEIHYLDDPVRGTAWEESIIFAPPHVKILGLSATVPNISELADWIADVRKSPVIVVQEKQRVVPLEIKWLTGEGDAVDQEDAQRIIKEYLKDDDAQDDYYDSYKRNTYGRRRS
ncbi:DEAD/DEAH box helicase [Desulfolucanica intricata]|uniref:DEAD/DEAH box helicase n=1 Tax=Desulfolucanica intricata TaxID=1285191 RepID=UPI00082FF7B2|nr:DEAD/DEAH box helicase [Desulfolucanica intricata]